MCMNDKTLQRSQKGLFWGRSTPQAIDMYRVNTGPGQACVIRGRSGEKSLAFYIEMW